MVAGAGCAQTIIGAQSMTRTLPPLSQVHVIFLSLVHGKKQHSACRRRLAARTRSHLFLSTSADATEHAIEMKSCMM